MNKHNMIAALAMGFGLAVAGPALAAPSAVSTCKTITQPGAYELTRNLLSGGFDCLVVAADFVTIDLNGFHIRSINPTGVGVTDKGVARMGVKVHNGSVSGFGIGIGLQACSGCTVKGVRAFSNSNDGIKLGEAGILLHNAALFNDDDGIVAEDGSVVKDNVAAHNGSEGIQADEANSVVHNATSENGGDGIKIDCPAVAIGNAADNNSGADLNLLGAGCIDTDNN